MLPNLILFNLLLGGGLGDACSVTFRGTTKVRVDIKSISLVQELD